MLKEGFDKRDIDCLIVVSTAITEAHHIQSIGRAIRLPNDAIIYILLAKDTTDEKVLKFKSIYKYEIVGDFTGKYDTPQTDLTKLFYASETYSLDYKYRIFQTRPYGREYYKPNPIIAELKEYLPRGGRFRISKDNKVMVMFKNKVVVVTMLTAPLDVNPVVNIQRDFW
jgi:superfamily II DNA or RNA helicase